MVKKELEKLIESLKIDRDEYWILSSGALVLRGILTDAGDLDIAVTKKGLEELMENYNLKQKENGWYIVTDKIECVLDTKEDWKIEKLGEYNLESIKKYYSYLLQSKREKDIARIPLINSYIKAKGLQ
ncbi:unknown [Clostridium sp. CAG:1219]|nr:unknown [Clostridium sp. CAG:1219]